MDGQNFDTDDALEDFNFNLSEFMFDEPNPAFAQQNYQNDESSQQYEYQQQQQFQSQMEQDQPNQLGYNQSMQEVQSYMYSTTSDIYTFQQDIGQSSDCNEYQLDVSEAASKNEESQIQQPQEKLKQQDQSLKYAHPALVEKPSTPQQAKQTKPDDVVFAVPELPARKIAKVGHTVPLANQSEIMALDESNAEASSSSEKKKSIADKSHISLLRQMVLHPVAPEIVEKMHSLPPVHESKDDELKTLSLNLQRYESVIPDATAAYILERSGINPGPGTDICARFLAVAAQKVVTDVLSDAITLAKSRGMGQTNRATKETKFLLTQDLVSEVLQEQGLSINHK